MLCETRSADKQRAMDRFRLRLMGTIKGAIENTVKELLDPNVGPNAALDDRKVYTLLLAIQLRQILMLQGRQGN